MNVADAAEAIAEAVERDGLLLVHDQELPSATAVVAGEPVMGSWWSHPDANIIYNALGALEERTATVKLISGKLTLVAPRLWADLVAIGSGRLAWQLNGLSADELALLDRIDAAADPVLLDTPDRRAAGKRLERRLLATAEEVHSDEGRHLKALRSWSAWAVWRGVAEPFPDPAAAMRRYETIVEGWGQGTASRLPWN